MMAAFLKRQIGRVDIVISGTEAAAIETGEVMAAARRFPTWRRRRCWHRGAQADQWRKSGRNVMRLAQQSSDVLVIVSRCLHRRSRLSG